MAMQKQKSYQNDSQTGILYLVPTPIGNLEDMTFRAVKILQTVDYIACEDTRQTQKLCRHFQISTPLWSYHEHNKEKSGEKIIGLLADGKHFALVSDAGTPCISDPGYELVQACLKKELRVVALPGANAALPSLLVSGLSPKHFVFYGFLPRKRKDRIAELQRLKTGRETLIFYEAPHRLKTMIQDVHAVLGERRVSVIRELTKKFEEVVRGSCAEIERWLTKTTPRGEYCIVVEGGDGGEDDEDQWWKMLSIADHVRHYTDIRHMATSEAIKAVARERGLPKREVYATVHR